MKLSENFLVEVGTMDTSFSGLYWQLKQPL